ncbi:uncharacterized protein LOC100180358 isoform X2 [Ciona intestinalis]
MEWNRIQCTIGGVVCKQSCYMCIKAFKTQNVKYEFVTYTSFHIQLYHLFNFKYFNESVGDIAAQSSINVESDELPICQYHLSNFSCNKLVLHFKHHIQYFHHEFGCPMTSKTVYAQNFYHNMRHPCFIGWTCVLWLVPCLSIDRFILASGFTLYLLHGSRLTVKDFYYVRKMYYKKVTSIVRVSKSP